MTADADAHAATEPTPVAAGVDAAATDCGHADVAGIERRRFFGEVRGRQASLRRTTGHRHEQDQDVPHVVRPIAKAVPRDASSSYRPLAREPAGVFTASATGLGQALNTARHTW
jgi:hypothetical protein